MEFIEENETFKVNELGVKNKWRFAWLDATDEQNNKIRAWCRKIKDPGSCFCIVCNQKVKYGSNGKKGFDKSQ